MASIEINGVSIHYEQQGSGPAVVLVHGLGGSAQLWEQLVPALAGEFRVVSYDLRGAGQSDKPPGPYTLDLLVSDLAALVEALELAPVILVGHSLAGGLVLAYAAEHADDVAAVVGVGAVCEVPDAGRAGLRERAAVVRDGGMADVAQVVAENGTDPSWRERDRDAYEGFRDAVAANDPEGYAALALVVADLDVSDRLERIASPVLLIAGGSDPVSPPAANLASVERLPNATYVSVAECGHIIPLERPQELLDSVRPFLREHAELGASL